MGRGLPYAVSSLLHYLILLLGFLAAIGAMGVDLNRVTLLTGAFGVGVGFGLQTIVNNFVSGIILLLERPIQVGDTIQIGQLSGEIRRIGIRSSTVRTSDGAEVIVPNGTFMTISVVNLTRFPTRRASLWLVVDDASKPIAADDVRTTLREAPGVAKEPPPSVELRSVSGGKARYLVTFWTAERDAALSAAVAALRARFPQGEVTSG